MDRNRVSPCGSALPCPIRENCRYLREKKDLPVWHWHFRSRFVRHDHGSFHEPDDSNQGHPGSRKRDDLRVTVAILSSVFPPGERGKALGIYITSVYFGLSMGPFLGGVLTQYFGWRSIFFVNVPIGIAAILLVTWKLKGDWAECQGERFDLAGIGYLRDSHCCSHVRALRCYRRRRIRVSSYRDSGRDRLCPVRNGGSNSRSSK